MSAHVHHTTGIFMNRILSLSIATLTLVVMLVGCQDTTGTDVQRQKADAERQKNEQLVKEGKMKKSETPFGSYYRKQ